MSAVYIPQAFVPHQNVPCAVSLTHSLYIFLHGTQPNSSYPQQRAPRLVSQLDPPEFVFREAPNFSVSAETEVGTATFDLYLPDQYTPCIPDIDAIAASTVYVAKNVTFDSVRRSSVCVSENAAIRQIWSIVVPEHAVSIYRSGAAVVCVTIAVDEVRVCNVYRILVWGEAETVWPPEPICYYSDIASRRIEAVYKLRENRFGTESLLVTVDRVCEPD